MQGLNISKLIPWKALAFVIASIALLAWWIHSLGAGQVAEQFIAGLAAFPMVLLISFFYAFLQALAWQLTVGPFKGSFWNLFTLEAGGNALRLLSPFALVGGDAVQGHQLQKKHEVKSGADSIITDRTVHIIATGIFVWVGLLVGFLNTPSLPLAVRVGVPVVVLLGGLFCIVAIRSSKRGFFAAIAAKTPSFGLPCRCHQPAFQGTLDEYDRLLLSFYDKKRGTFFQALILHLICQGLMVGEVYLIGTALLPEFTLSWALLLAALAPVVTCGFNWFPGTFGIMELAFAGLLALAFGPFGALAGTALVLIRRLRALCWIVAGLIFSGNPFKMFLGK